VSRGQGQREVGKPRGSTSRNEPTINSPGVLLEKEGGKDTERINGKFVDRNGEGRST